MNVCPLWQISQGCIVSWWLVVEPSPTWLSICQSRMTQRLFGWGLVCLMWCIDDEIDQSVFLFI